MALKEGDRLAIIDAYGRIVQGENHHEFEVVATEDADEDSGEINIRLKQIN